MIDQISTSMPPPPPPPSLPPTSPLRSPLSIPAQTNTENPIILNRAKKDPFKWITKSNFNPNENFSSEGQRAEIAQSHKHLNTMG